MIYNCSYSNPVNIGSSTEQFTYASSSCELANPTSSVASIENGFTHGEIVGTILLFLIFFLMAISLFWSLFKLKIK
jgi:hypothetical protein